MNHSLSLFHLNKRVVVITGAAGLLGLQHAIAIRDAGGIPVLTDVSKPALDRTTRLVGRSSFGIIMDVTNLDSIHFAKKEIIRRFTRIDVLINNAARNPKVEIANHLKTLLKYHESSLSGVQEWDLDLNIGLKGALLCSQIFGDYMAKKGKGVILNIASDLALISPDQRLYFKRGLSRQKQPKKPVSYSVVKSGLLGLTRYFATYWADRGVRVNALCPGGVFNGHSKVFLKRITKLIPMGRMARVDEYRGAIIFLCSDASSYMTGSILSIDGGRTTW